VQDYVKVRNVGGTVHTMKWGGSQFILPPGGDPVTVPTAAVVRSVGNWEAVDSPQKGNVRGKERDRLSTKYATYGASWYSQSPAVTAAIQEEDKRSGERFAIEPTKDYDSVLTADNQRQFMHPNLPKIEVTDADTGARILTVVDDPDGTIGTGGEILTIEKDGRDAEIGDLRAKMDAMMAKLAEMDPTAAAEVATAANLASRADLPALHDVDEADGPNADRDAATSDDAMDIMGEELGLKPPARKKAAAKKVTVRRSDPVGDVGDEL